jgi:hypothetical protein
MWAFFLIISRALRHFSHAGLLYPYPNEFRHSTPEALHTKRRERPLLAKDGTKTKESILLATRNFRKLQSWDMGHLIYFPSEGRPCWEFLLYRKNPTASAGIEPANSGSRGQHANQ